LPCSLLRTRLQPPGQVRSGQVRFFTNGQRGLEDRSSKSGQVLPYYQRSPWPHWQADPEIPESPPGPSRPDLAGRIAGIFPIPIGPGSGENARDFAPIPTRPGFREIGNLNPGDPVWSEDLSGSRDSGNRESRFGRDRENPAPMPGHRGFRGLASD
jgi:hypothetical protein